MMKRGYWLARAAGGAVAGVLMAGAGVGIAVAGAAGNSDQYTPGAKPYAGAHPNAVTVGTSTYPSTVTTNITSTTVTETGTVTGPYITAPYTTELVTEYYELEEAASDLAADQATITAQGKELTSLLKSDLRSLLEPSGSYLKIKTLAKAKSVSLAFASPGSGKVTILWKVSVKGKKSTDYVDYTDTLKKLGAITIKLPTKADGRKLLTGAKNGTIAATVTYKATSGASIKVTRTYKLVS